MTRRVGGLFVAILFVFVAVNAASAQEAVVAAEAVDQVAVMAPCGSCNVAPCCCVAPCAVRCYRPRVIVAPSCDPCCDPCFDPCCGPVVYRRGLFGHYRPVVWPRYYRGWYGW